MKKPKKKFSPLEVFKNSAVGLIISWSDKDPLNPEMVEDRITDSKVSHVNPVNSTFAAITYHKCKDLLLNQIPMTWKITIDGIFEYPEGTLKETRELYAYCPLKLIDSEAEHAIREILRYQNRESYVRTDFTTECISKRNEVNALEKERVRLALIKELTRQLEGT